MNSICRGDEVISITHLPGYKRPALCIGTQLVIHKVASFNSEEDAEEFCALLNDWFGLNREEKEE